MLKIKYTTKRNEPFMKKNSIYKVIGFGFKGQPLVKDNTGITLRLNLKKDYQIIK